MRLLNGAPRGDILSEAQEILVSSVFAKERQIRYYEAMIGVMSNLEDRSNLTNLVNSYTEVLVPEFKMAKTQSNAEFKRRSKEIMDKLFSYNFVLQPQGDEESRSYKLHTFHDEGLKSWKNFVESRMS